MAFRVRRKKGVNALRVGFKVVATVLGLWVGGYILNIVGTVMKCTCSPFYKGLSMIGWTLTDNSTTSTTGCTSAQLTANTCLGDPNVVTSTTGSGILAVVGIIAIASIVMEFVDISW